MERIGRDVERELARSGSRDAIPLAAVTAAWPDVVGDAISRHAWPLRLARDGTLHVATSSATWASELAFLADEIRDRLRSRLGSDAPARLRCAVGPIPEWASSEDAPARPATSPADVPDDIAGEAAAAAASIDDPELRELVARAARASLLHGRSGR